MSMRTTIQDLRAHADVANDEHKVKVRTGQFTDLSAVLQPALAALPALNIGLAEVEQLDADLSEGRAQEAAQVADNLRALASELPVTSIDTSLDLAKARVRSAEKYVSEVRALVAGAWHGYVNQPAPAINSDLIDALDQGGVDVDEIRESLESARGRLVAITNRTIPQQGDVTKFNDAMAAIQTCGEQLGKVVDPDIAEGIVATQGDAGMPLGWFTPERFDKLAALGITDRFRVRLQ